MDMDMMFTADAIEHSDVGESNGELHFTTPDEFKLAMNEKDILKVVQKVAGRPMRIKIAFGNTNVTEGSVKPKPVEDEATKRALENAEVRRFQEVFPDAEVRTVRNLKD